MSIFLHQVALATPLFVLVLAGYALTRWARWPATIDAALSQFVFSVALPALLFRLMSRLSEMPPIDARLLVAFFGGCFVTFAIGRLIAAKLFALDGAGQSIFAMGGVFSNNVMLGLPIAKLTLGDAALPAVSLVLVFNALILWTLGTASVEWSRSGSLSLAGFRSTASSVMRNPIIVGVLAGTAFGLTGWHLPMLVDVPLQMLGDCAPTVALIALGMGLARYGWREHATQSLAITALKLLVQPLVVWALALLIGLPSLETRVVVLLASMSVGANVYQMARQFHSLEAATAASLLYSTALAALTTPVFLALTAP
jgi:malonate transporter